MELGTSTQFTSFARYWLTYDQFTQTIANSWRISGDIIDVCILLLCDRVKVSEKYLQEFTGYDDRCPCDDMLDCKLPGFRESVPCL